MLFLSNASLLLVNAFTYRSEYSILFIRASIIVLLYSALLSIGSLHVRCLEQGIGIYNGLFQTSAITQSMDLLMYILAPVVLLLSGFYGSRSYGNKLENPMLPKNTQIQETLRGLSAEQFTIVTYPLVTLFILIGAILLMSSSDLISMFLAIELQSYGLYIFATLYRNSEWSTSAGLTYFLLGGLSSCFILLGSALLYANCGLTSLDGIYVFSNIEIPSTSFTTTGHSEILSMGLLIMSCGYLFKISAAPFHFWSPDVYDALDTVVTTFVANLPKISILIFLLGLTHGALSKYPEFSWTNVFLVSSFLSLVVGTVGGLVQFRIKKLLAYSSISNVGFLLLALSINSVESIQAFILYLSQYMLTNINIFFIIILIGVSHHCTVGSFCKNVTPGAHLGLNSNLLDREHSPLQLISQLKGYFYHNPVLALSFAISIFSLAGIPPLLGFFAKQLVLSAALNNGYVFLSLIGILTSVIGGVYYLMLIKAMFFDKSDESSNEDKSIVSTWPSSPFTITVSVLTLANLLFILYPKIWLRSASVLAMTLFNP
uniref:NADH-ubiquinone oxidoreductase chain 2 n=1 Tax=Pyronema omphalodes TaxID=337075 RepID=A0A140IMV2_9PEZI|nr:NADH-ubiquinone oxidoreductase chain 2 [Pyronema omphalodes]AMO66510.1 NADH-ubiquinone oxidoreductase chain 2 [Pyronema omphalodes]